MILSQDQMLIIKLNRNLEILNHTSDQTQLIFENKTDGKIILELFKNFQEIWSVHIWDHIKNQNQINILFILGPKAGFTDARVVSIWLNSLVLFEIQKNIKLSKYLDFQVDVDMPNYLDQNLNQILTQISWNSHLNASIYTREPSIGKP